jgi:hypothetical protein
MIVQNAVPARNPTHASIAYEHDVGWHATRRGDEVFARSAYEQHCDHNTRPALQGACPKASETGLCGIVATFHTTSYAGAEFETSYGRGSLFNPIAYYNPETLLFPAVVQGFADTGTLDPEMLYLSARGAATGLAAAA